MVSGLARGFLVIAGTLLLAVGVVGIVVPLLPTTPFLLLAAACYLRGSERLHDWLLGSRWLGDYIRNYREGNGIPARTKFAALFLLWATIGASAILVVDSRWIRLVLFIIALGVTYHILSMKTLRQKVP